MPIASDSGSGGTRRRPPRGGPILVAPTATAPVVAPAAAPVLGGKGGTGGRPAGSVNKATTAAGNSSASSSVSSAQAAYEASQRKAAEAARDRNVRDAENMQGQVEALRRALGLNSRDGKLNGTFKKALHKRLANINLVRDQQLDIVRDGFEDRLDSLQADADNNNTAASDSSITNETNRGRERASAISEAMAQGAGESDSLKVQLHALRNWDANQNDINRAFYDGARSIDGAVNDLNIDTRTGLANVFSEANADKQQMHDNFWNQTSESQTQLGNVLGQQAEYYGLAREAMDGLGKPGKTVTKTKASSSSSSTTKAGSKMLGAPKGKTAQVTSAVPGGVIDVKDREFNARPTATVQSQVIAGGPDDGRPAAGDQDVPKDWDKPGQKLGNKGGGKGRPKRGAPGSGSLRERQEAAAAASDKQFMGATKSTKKVWKNPGLPDEIENWQDTKLDTVPLANSLYAAARTVSPLKAPEGATLRKW